MKTNIILLIILYSLIFITSVVSYYGNKDNQDSLHYLVIHSGNINLQVKNEGFHRYEIYIYIYIITILVFLFAILFIYYFRILHTSVTADFETSNRKDCAITIKYEFPADIYVDKYELVNNDPNHNVSVLLHVGTLWFPQ